MHGIVRLAQMFLTGWEGFKGCRVRSRAWETDMRERNCIQLDLPGDQPAFVGHRRSVSACHGCYHLRSDTIQSQSFCVSCHRHALFQNCLGLRAQNIGNRGTRLSALVHDLFGDIRFELISVRHSRIVTKFPACRDYDLGDNPIEAGIVCCSVVSQNRME